MYFSPGEESRIQEAAAQLEAKTGVQILAAVVGKADNYPEVPWKAFALAASLSAFVLLVQALLDPPWFTPLHAAFYAVAVLGIGAAAALLAMLLPPVARWLAGSARLAAEVEQYASAFFLERELFRTRQRTGILILISLFERKIVILPDEGAARRLDENALAEIVKRMRLPLSRGAHFDALLAGLAALEAALLTAGFQGTEGAPDELPRELVEEEGVGE